MKNLKWNKVFSLCKIQIAEFLKAFSKLILLVVLLILVWPLLISGGDILSSCNTIARWILTLSFTIISLMNSMFFIGANNKLILPASHIEKYISMWLSSIVLTVIGITLSIAIILPLLYGLNVISFQEDFKEMGLTMIHAISLSKLLNSFAISIGTVLLVISQFIPKPKKHIVSIVLLLSLVLNVGLLFLLPDSLKDMFMLLFSGILSIGFWVWGYQCFKLVQLYKKK